jgi:hypothetical protein
MERIGPITLQNAAAATGNGVPMGVAGFAQAVVQLEGTFSATVTWEGTADNPDATVTWVAIPAVNLNTGAPGSTATAAGLYSIGCAGLSMVRARISAYTSGNVTATGRAVPAASSSSGGIDTAGSLKVSLWTANAGQAIGQSTNTDAQTPGNNLLFSVTSYAWSGAGWDRLRTPNIWKTIAAVAVTAGTPQTVWTPAAGKKFRLMGFAVSLTVAGSVIFDDNAVGTEIIRTPLLAAGTGIASPPMGNGFLSAAANNVLQVNVSATGSVSGFVYGTEE